MKKIFLLFLLISCGTSSKNWNPVLKSDNSKIIIVNSDTIQAKEIVIEINGDYSYELKELKIGDKREIEYSEFVNSSSERLEIDKIKIEKISISGKNEKGEFIHAYFEPN